LGTLDNNRNEDKDKERSKRDKQSSTIGGKGFALKIQ
jgi:hypothetical protein